MFDIENRIKENLAFFNDREPDEGHKARFASRLSDSNIAKPKKITIQSFIMIAAALLLLIATSYLILRTVSVGNKNEIHSVTDIVYPQELIKVQNYYDELSVSRLNQIDNHAKSEEEAQKIKVKAQKKMDKLDANLAMIEKEYMKNPQSERLKAAIVVNKKMKAEVAENIVEQLGNAQLGYHAGSMFTNY
jgi:hypothetical protein|tara:strand:- start:1739 stop:2308 length:570 start_codon:yes stop_codon:yes gene_type:complete